MNALTNVHTNLVRISGLVTPCSGSVKYTPRVAINSFKTTPGDKLRERRAAALPLLRASEIVTVVFRIQILCLALGPWKIERETMGPQDRRVSNGLRARGF